MQIPLDERKNHMRHIVTKTAQTILFTGTVLFAFCTSALADIDWKRMKRDLSIQESILDQFFDEKKVSTTGLYIENHGILLIASGGMKKYEIRVHAIGDKKLTLLYTDNPSSRVVAMLRQMGQRRV